MQSTESMRGATCSPRAIPDDSASYFELNQKLSFPNNPAYFSIKKLKTSTTKQAQYEAKKKQQADRRTLLDYCREHGLPFTNEDKLMYSIQNSRKFHKIFKAFLDRDVDMLGNPQDQFSLSASLQEVMQQVQQLPEKKSNFKDENLAFNKYGEFNMSLTEEEMVKYYFDALDDKIVVPLKKDRSKEGALSNQGKKEKGNKDENGGDDSLS